MLEVIEAEEKKTKNDFNCKTVKSILFMKIYRVIQGHKEELRKLKKIMYNEYFHSNLEINVSNWKTNISERAIYIYIYTYILG